MARTPKARATQRAAVERRARRRLAAVQKLTELGRERHELEERLQRNEREIVSVLRARKGDVTIVEAADATGLCRATMHRWRGPAGD